MMMPLNELIRLYNSIDSKLRKIVGVGPEPSFSSVVDRARNVPGLGGLLRQENRAFLKHAGEVRNVAVHSDNWPVHLIAINEDGLARLRELDVQLDDTPQTVLDLSSAKPEVFLPDAPLRSVLRHMGENDFSQVIVRRTEDELTLLTSEGIARWIELQLVNEGGLLVTDEPVSVALEHDLPNAHLVWSREKPAAHAVEAFADSTPHRGARLFAIIITETGASSETPLGIVTPWDLV